MMDILTTSWQARLKYERTVNVSECMKPSLPHINVPAYFTYFTKSPEFAESI